MTIGEVTLHARDGETTVIVRGYQVGRLQGFTIHSSNACDEPLHAPWPRSLADAIISRRLDGGAAQGRILYAFQVRWHQPDLPVGALTLHIEDRLVRVKSVGVSEDKDSAFAPVILGLLLDCASAIAEKHGCDRLEWAVRNEEAARSACRRFGFRRVPRRGRNVQRRQKSERGVVLLERSC